MTKYYLTTAIPYANAAPHIGTAMDYLYGDILLRYHRLKGQDAKLSIGTDEHGSKVEQKAKANNLTPQAFVDNLQADFQKMRAALDLHFGVDVSRVGQPLAKQDLVEQNIIGVRTTDPDHIRRVQAIWQRLDQAGVIYKSTYQGWYCSGCEAFVTDSEAKEHDYICPDHNQKYEKLSEENYYLAVSKFTEPIKQFITSSVVPEFRGKELLELVKDGAKDVSISRPIDKLTWGIPVPGDESQVMYVWIDALANYITALGYPDENWQQDYWPAEVEIVGKDILRFHAIIWPAILLALGLELPQKIMVHGFINVEGKKMSKTIGNVVSPLDIIDQYGVDAFRYYFIKHVPTFEDGDFTWQKFEAAYNGELANDLGNLVSRTSAMIKKYFQGSLLFNDSDNNQKSLEIHDAIETMHGRYTVAMDSLDLNMAMAAVMDFVRYLNKYIEQNAPWQVAKLDDADERDKRLAEIFSNLVTGLTITSQYLAPFLPSTADSIHKLFIGHELPAEVGVLFPKKYQHTVGAK